jgi:hypothetical protein
MLRVVYAALAIILVAAIQPRGQAPKLAPVTQAAGTGWAQFRLDGASRPVNVFLVEDDEPKPVVLLLQGSGCRPQFVTEGAGPLQDTSIFQDLVPERRTRFHFVLIEKQGVTPLRFESGMTLAQKRLAFERAGRECTCRTSGRCVRGCT